MGGLCWIFLILALPSSGQEMYFQKYTVDDGLAYDHAVFFLQDKRGYLWIGTDQGLSRFDGIEFKNFFHDPGDSLSLSQNQVKRIKEDEEGYLWVLTTNGLSRYDPRSETFKNYDGKIRNKTSLQDYQFRSIHLDIESDALWLGTLNKGLIRFDLASGKLQTYYLAKRSPYWRSANTINWIQQDKANSNRLWLATQKGLYSFDKEKRSFEHHTLEGVPAAKTIAISKLLMEEPGELWCATWNLGLLHYKFEENISKQYRDLPGMKDQNLVVRCLLNYNDREILMGTLKHGLLLFDREKKSIRRLTEKGANRGLEKSHILNLYKDQSGGIWIATGNNGIYVLNPRYNQFNKLSIPNEYAGSAEDKLSIFDAEYLPETEQIISTYHKNGSGGLIVFDKNMSYSHLMSYPSRKSSENLRMSFIFRDNSGNIWTTAQGRLLRFDLEEHRFQSMYEKHFEVLIRRPNDLKKMIIDQKGHIWLATEYSGIIEIVPEADTVYQYLELHGKDTKFYTFDIVEDKSGKIWLATNFGLFLIDQKEKTIQHPLIHEGRKPEKRVVVDLFSDENGNIWYATEAYGAHIIDIDSLKVVKVMDRSNGLPSDMVRDILKDESGNYWIATTGGLACLDASSGNIRTFSQVDGLQPFRCEKIDLFSNGTLLIFNDDIPTYCHIDDLQIDTSSVPIVFQSILANNKKLDLTPTLNFRDEVELNHEQNAISIQFAALSFTKPQQQRYAYRLKGLNEEWQYAEGANRVATYANLSPGTYQFQLKATNADGIWNNKHSQFTVTLSPPWWNTYWAYIVYTFGSIVFLYAIYRFRLRKRLVEEEARHLREMDAFKTRFYTNITHEFRTPITVIQGMAKQLSGNSKAQNLIIRNSQQLLMLVNQMLDLSRLEEGKLPLNTEHGDIVAFLNYLTESMQSLAAKKEIQLVFYSEENSLKMAFDADKIQQVVQNLLANAVKFTPEKGKVILHLRREKEMVKLSVQDTGKGIHPEDLPHVFKRFYQSPDGKSDHKNSSTGVGLALVKELVELMNGRVEVESRLGEGSRFTVRLPIEKSEEAMPPLEENKQISGIPTSDMVVLIIEDNTDVVIYLQEYLKDDYKVQTATNGQEGIEKAFSLVPDIILCDVMMPLKDGYEVAEILKSDQRTSHIPIIMLTAKAAKEDRIKGLNTGVDAYLVKPFEHKELEVRLRQLLQLRKKLQRRYANGLPETQMPSQDDLFLRKIYDFIQQEISNEQLSVHDISRHMHLSRMQVHRKLKALTGQSTTQLMQSLRMKRAKQLLEETDMPISEVAYSVGYADPNYFSRQFVSCFSVPPSEIRTN
jgi:signal transduction histidine kinase/ligand-binding sensor domain-containing protein/DNA-binding response OmpR family regulator